MASFVFAWMQIKKWKRNPRVICAFLVLLLLCLTMTSEYVDYSKEIGLSIQVFEPFILMFTQRYSLLFIMLIILLLLAGIACGIFFFVRRQIWKHRWRTRSGRGNEDLIYRDHPRRNRVYRIQARKRRRRR